MKIKWKIQKVLIKTVKKVKNHSKAIVTFVINIDTVTFFAKIPPIDRMLEDTTFYLIYGWDAIFPQDMFLGSTVNSYLREKTNNDLDQFKIQIIKT